MPNFRLEVDPAAPGQIGDALHDLLLKQIGPKIQQAAKRTVPVDTFSLRDSIVIQVIREGDDSVLEVGVDEFAPGVENVPVDYALYVEYGTSKMAAQPFLRPAVYQARGKIR